MFVGKRSIRVWEYYLKRTVFSSNTEELNIPGCARVLRFKIAYISKQTGTTVIDGQEVIHFVTVPNPWLTVSFFMPIGDVQCGQLPGQEPGPAESKRHRLHEDEFCRTHPSAVRRHGWEHGRQRTQFQESRVRSGQLRLVSCAPGVF